MTKKIFITLLKCLLPLLFLFSCATNPVTGKKEFMLLSEADEARLGEQTDRSIIAQYGIYDDLELVRYVEDVGFDLDEFSHRPQLPYSYKVMDSDVINAFAVPGGYVYVTRGILAYLNSEAELAGVLGHEIGHIAARHSAQQYSNAQLAQLTMGVGSMVSEDFKNLAGAAQLGVGLLFSSYSRDNERQADSLGVEYSSRSGYDAREMANFFETLNRLHPSQGAGGLPNWFSTHPDPPERVMAIKEQADQWSAQLGSGEIGRVSYLSQINGLTIGPDPQEGYVLDNMFYHPQLTFQIPVPAGWQVLNTRTQLQFAEPMGESALIFSLKPGSGPSQEADNFIQGNQAQVLSQTKIRVNGYDGVKLSSQLTTEKGILTVLSYFIDKDNITYCLHGLASQETAAKYNRILESSLTGFSRLTDSSRINVYPGTIGIKKAKTTDRLRNILISLGVETALLEKTALLNGFYLTDTVKAGTSLKIVNPGYPVMDW